MHATCVDLTDVLGPGDPRHLRPLATEAGPLLVPIDRAAVDLVWAASGYPSHAAYRDHHHRTARTTTRGPTTARVYDPARAAEQAASDAADFVARGGRSRARRRAVRLRAGHRAARPLVVRGRMAGAVVEEAGRRGSSSPTSTMRSRDSRARPRGAARPPTTTLGHASATSRPGRARGWPTSPGARARRARRARRAAPAWAPARCASCWRCSAATGLPGLGRHGRRLPA